MKALNFGLLAFGLFCFACWLGNWSENIDLRQRLEQNQAVIGDMRREHESAINAAMEARKAREEIYELQRQRMCEAEAALGNHPDYCSQPVPDDLRLLWQGKDSEAGDVPAAGGAAHGH